MVEDLESIRGPAAGVTQALRVCGIESRGAEVFGSDEKDPRVVCREGEGDLARARDHGQRKPIEKFGVSQWVFGSSPPSSGGR